MSRLSADFLAATKQAEELHKRGDLIDSEKATLYGLYKQATAGDNMLPQPSFFDFKNKAKWSAWNQWRSTSSTTAQEEYIRFVQTLDQPVSSVYAKYAKYYS